MSLFYRLSLLVSLVSLIPLACTPEDPVILYDTQEVINAVFGNTLPVYASCDTSEVEKGTDGPQFIISSEYGDPCSLDHLAQCELGDESICESQPPVCFQDASQAKFCTQVCESDDDCPENGMCVSSSNKRGSSIKKFGIEEVRSELPNGLKMCVTQEIIDRTQTRLQEQIEVTDLPQEHEACDLNAEIDLCMANHEINCLARALPEDQCYPAMPSSPVKCVDSDTADQGVCRRLCTKGCMDGDECDGDYCVPSK